jgi:hypothetical protein
VRYFKNERFGFSVTYYEGNRPRQYYPDFIAIVREDDGREVTWIVETKAEIRPNTGLKSEAAQLWCERMSATAYGAWQFLFVPQRKFEFALAAGAKSLADLSRARVHPKPEPQPRLISTDEGWGAKWSGHRSAWDNNHSDLRAVVQRRGAGIRFWDRTVLHSSLVGQSVRLGPGHECSV